MYQCAGCEGIVENTEGQCFCGKTITDRKGNVVGENFSEVTDRWVSGKYAGEKSSRKTCPHCGWEGMVVPRFGIGCPEHGLWYKNTEEKHTVLEEKEDGDEPVKTVTGDERRRLARADRREKSRNRKERKVLRRSGGKRSNRNTKM